MKLKRLVACRSNGRVFVLLKGIAADCVSVSATAGNASVPAEVYPLDVWTVRRAFPNCSDVDALARHLSVLVLPFLEGQTVEVHVQDAMPFSASGDMARFRLNMTALKWESRVNYRTNKTLCEAVRDVQVSHLLGHYQMEFTRYIPGDAGAVWRVCIEWSGSDAHVPQLTVYDPCMRPLDARIHIFEYQPQVKRSDGTSCNRLMVSIVLAEDLRDFVVCAMDETANGTVGAVCSTAVSADADPSTVDVTVAGAVVRADLTTDIPIAAGFCAMDGRHYNSLRDASWRRMKDARADDGAYRVWFEQHRATPGDLACQRAASESFAYQPAFSIVVPCFNTDATYLRELVASVQSQSYCDWELLLVDASPDSPVVSDAVTRAVDERVKRIPLETNGGIVTNTNAGIERATGDIIAFLDHDDLLEPDALYRYAQALNDTDPDTRPQVLFCDEDMFEQTGTWMQPVFKTDLNVDLLYSHNCVTHFLAIDAELLGSIGVSPEDVAGAQDYDLTLRALAAGARFKHMPHVLYHWRIHPGSTADGSSDSKPYAIEAGRLALQRHFDSLRIAGIVEETATSFVYRMRYALPEPAPLVSIVIPTKDHVDVLDRCLMSIADKATYPTYEVLLVENNSSDEATFAYYEDLPERFAERSQGRGALRVETWNGPFNYSQIIDFGVKASSGDYLLLLNNDTEVISPDFIQEMMGYLQREDVGVVGAKLYYADNTTQHAGMLVGVRGAVAHANQDFSPKREGYLARAVRPGNFSAVTGACQMVRRDVFDRVGGYDETFIVGFNDADFCLRVGEAGYRTVYTPYAELYHYEFTSRGREEADQTKLERWKREQALFMQRWPRYFLQGDPFINPNLDRDNDYFDLPR